MHGKTTVCYVKPKLLLVLYIIAALDTSPFTHLRISKIMKKTAKATVREVVNPQKGYFWTNKGRVIIRYNKYPRYLRINICNVKKYSPQQCAVTVSPWVEMSQLCEYNFYISNAYNLPKSTLHGEAEVSVTVQTDRSQIRKWFQFLHQHRQ